MELTMNEVVVKTEDGEVEEKVQIKKPKIDFVTNVPSILSPTATAQSKADFAKQYAAATKQHPFYHNAHSLADVYRDCVLRDGNGNIIAVLIRRGLPEQAARLAADTLRPAAVRTTLRTNIYGGEAPMSGIAGYFDYRGSPVEFKYRKTAFTFEHAESWPDVFPMIDYVSALYRRVMPTQWASQDAAIPDVVRLRGSPFSTLTINSRFRTASHTDAGDFDKGYGCLACLEGNFKGMCLTMDSFRVNVTMQPLDVLIFDTHHFHSNTEPEVEDGGAMSHWSRLTCVFYYRTALGEAAGYAEYTRRLRVALASEKKLSASRSARAAHNKQVKSKNSNKTDTSAAAAAAAAATSTAKSSKGSPDAQPVKPRFTEIVVKDNGENFCKPSVVYPATVTPFSVIASLRCGAGCAGKAMRVHELLCASVKCGTNEEAEEERGSRSENTYATMSHALFGEALCTPDGIEDRAEDALIYGNSAPLVKAPAMGGFSECDGALQAAANHQHLLHTELLSQWVGESMMSLWLTARQRWLDLVHEAWQRSLAHAPERTDFTWNNRSEMNTAFFDLCEVGKQVHLCIIGKASASPAEETLFWTLFATHLHTACVEELHMPIEAMSMRKLNVKLKDFHFGGTRYFKDMPAAEQQRRLEHAARIRAARCADSNRSACDSSELVSQTMTARKSELAQMWLRNDSFDYQTEDCPVDYAAQGWITPEENARRCVERADAAADAPPVPCEESVPIRILVLLPSESGSCADDACAAQPHDDAAHEHAHTHASSMRGVVTDASNSSDGDAAAPEPSECSRALDSCSSNSVRDANDTNTNADSHRDGGGADEANGNGNVGARDCYEDEGNRCAKSAEYVTSSCVCPDSSQSFSSSSSTEMVDAGFCYKTDAQKREWARLMCNPAAQRIRQLSHGAADAAPTHQTLRHPACLRYGSTEVHYRSVEDAADATWSGDGEQGMYDFVVAQHILCTMHSNEDAAYFIQRLQRLATGFVLVAESDVQCRHYYMLKNTIREDYRAVAGTCFRALLRCRYHIANACVRSKPELEGLTEDSCARFKFKDSPLNTMLLVVSGTGTKL